MTPRYFSLWIVVLLLVSCSQGMPSSNKSKKILDVPKLVNKFTKMIAKSKQSIFNKSKSFKWGCGNKCDTQKRMLNVIKETRGGKNDLIGLGGDIGFSKLSGTSKNVFKKAQFLKNTKRRQ